MSGLIIVCGLFVFAIWLWHRHDLKKNHKKPDTRPSQPMPSAESKTLQVASASGNGSYTVDTADLTCTCPDFFKRRSNFDRSDPRRLCKHLLASIDEIDHFDMETVNEIFHVSAGKGFPVNDRHIKTISGEHYALHIPPDRDRPWVNVYNGQEKYGYNIAEERWAYGSAPPHQNTVAQWIAQLYAQPSQLST